ncbi:MAG: ABC transporter substrate-binding protein, partial [Rikenellaceae bacterium]
MGKRFLLSIIGVVCISIASCLEASAARENVLKVYNWADYMDESLLDEFEEWYMEQTGERVKIIYQTFDLNEVALAKVERAKADYDLMCPSEYIIERMLKKDLLTPIIKDFGDTPNYLGNIAPYITETFDQISTPDRKAADYAIPFMWGTTGLLYNTRTVTPEEASSWAVIWDEKFRNRIFMKDAVRDVYGIVQIYINQDRVAEGGPLSDIVNDSSQESISRVAEHLINLRDNVAGWEVDFGKEMMTKEKADISLSYSGDAVWAKEEGAEVGVELDYIVPQEGSIVWFDGWVIPKYAKNVKAASYFINFMCRPDNALRNMYEIGYVTAVATPE